MGVLTYHCQVNDARIRRLRQYKSELKYKRYTEEMRLYNAKRAASLANTVCSTWGLSGHWYKEAREIGDLAIKIIVSGGKYEE